MLLSIRLLDKAGLSGRCRLETSQVIVMCMFIFSNLLLLNQITELVRTEQGVESGGDEAESVAPGFKVEQITRRQSLVQTRKKFLTIPETPLLELPSGPDHEPHKMISLL